MLISTCFQLIYPTVDINLPENQGIKNLIDKSIRGILFNNNPKMFNRFLALDKKIGYTCKLLMQDNMSIAEVCHKSGFNNVSNFNRQFRKTYSMSPREYRAKM